MNCPHCHKPLSVTIAKPTPAAPPEFDAEDPIQQEGYEAAKFNGQKRKASDPKDWRKCPYADRTDEYYRYNRGQHQFWNHG